MCCVCYMHAQKYFASGIGQNGEETEGIQGFLIKHIQSEVVRSHRGKNPSLYDLQEERGKQWAVLSKAVPKLATTLVLRSLEALFFNTTIVLWHFVPCIAPNNDVLDLSSLPVHMDTQTCCICLSRIKCEPSLHELYCPTCLTFLHRDCLQVKWLLNIYSETTLLDRLASSISFQGLCNFLSVN